MEGSRWCQPPDKTGRTTPSRLMGAGTSRPRRALPGRDALVVLHIVRTEAGAAGIQEWAATEWRWKVAGGANHRIKPQNTTKAPAGRRNFRCPCPSTALRTGRGEGSFSSSRGPVVGTTGYPPDSPAGLLAEGKPQHMDVSVRAPAGRRVAGRADDRTGSRGVPPRQRPAGTGRPRSQIAGKSRHLGFVRWLAPPATFHRHSVAAHLGTP